MNEILIAILLPILLTGIAYGIAEFFMKILKIKHPKNTFFIYLLILIISISLTPITALSFSESTDGDSQPLSPNLSDLSSDQLKNMSSSKISSKITPLSDQKNPNNIQTGTIPSKFILEISWYDMIIEEEINDDTSGNVNAADSVDNKDQGSFINSLIQSIEKLPPFIYCTITLFIIAFFFVIYQLFLGEKHYLKKIQATPSKNEKLNILVKQLSSELHLKMPKIYQYQGLPNAFVIGCPAILVISNELTNILSEKELKTTLRHELTHIKHHDIIFKAFIQSTRIIFFYNPFVHIIAKKLFNKRELLADASYNTSYGDKVSFMEALIKIAEYAQSRSKISPAISVSLLELSPAHPSMTERFISLFKQCRKKTVLTILVSLIILLSNGAAVLFTQSYFSLNSSLDEPESSSEHLVNVEKQYMVEDITYTTIYQNNEQYRGKMVHRTLYNVVSLPSFSNNSNIQEIINYIIFMYYQNQQKTSAF